MMCQAFLARTSTATLALVASGYLAVSGTAAETAKNKNKSELLNDGWSVQVWPGATRVASVDEKTDTQKITKVDDKVDDKPDDGADEKSAMMPATKPRTRRPKRRPQKSRQGGQQAQGRRRKGRPIPAGPAV